MDKRSEALVAALLVDRRWIWSAFGAAAALAPALWMRGFTVDDALISIRYAHHVALGLGHRWNENGAATDGVTPLLWPYLVAPFAKGAALATLAALRAIGIAMWTLSGALLGYRALELGGPRRASIALVLLAFVFPIGAWSASGMETPLVTLLATMAALCMRRPALAAALAGVAASFRPEMTPWAIAIAIGASYPKTKPMVVGVLAAILPVTIVSIVRLSIFGSAAPLAVMAKPSDLSHGFTYAGAAVVVVLLPIVAPWRRAITIAFAVHALAVVLAGGDWMPYARLVVPVTPSLVLAIATAGSPEKPLLRVFQRLRWICAFALGLYLLVRVSPNGRDVLRDRTALVEQARPVLASSKTIAVLDIGWVSAAYDGPIVDLAGLTDPSIAALPGGHTSKRVDVAMLLDRNVDTIIFWGTPREVELRLYGTPLFRQRYARAEDLPLTYTVFRRVSSSSSDR